MARGDGKNLKFRILCKKCNSYQHTVATPHLYRTIRIHCANCGNTAEGFDEEFDRDQQ